MSNITLNIEPLTQESFAPFGDVIETQGRDWFPINGGNTERYHALGDVQIDEIGKPIISIFRATPLTLPLTIEMMEHHPLGSQAFIPLAQEKFLIVVANKGEFDTKNIRVFLSNGHQGVNYHRSVWHHPIIALDKVSDFLVVDRAGDGNNCIETYLGANPTFVIEPSAL